MADVMIKCPETGEAVPTGVGIPWEIFKSPGLVLSGNSFECPSCRQMHTWDKGDAFPDT